MNRTHTRACAHDDDLIERAALGLLTPAEEPALARRLSECPICRARLAEDRALAAALAALDPHPAPMALDPHALPALARCTTRTLPGADGDEGDSTVRARPVRRSTRRRYEGWYVAAALLLLAGMAAFTFNSFAAPQLGRGPHATATATHTPRPTPTATPRPLALPTGTMLTGLAMVSPNEGWATGRIMPLPSGPDADQGSLILHYTTGQWTTTARYPSLALDEIEMISASEGWISGATRATSATSPTVPVILHYHDGTWTEQDLSGVGTPVKLQMFSASEGWALGGLASSTGTGCPNGASTCSGGGVGGGPGPHNSGILHYGHGAWSVVSFPADLSDAFWLTWHIGAEDLSMDGPNDGWAICQGDLMHYHDGQWSYGGRLPGMGGHSRIAMLSATDGWATSPGMNGINPTPEVAYHYDGKAWSSVPLPASLTAQGGDDLLRAYPQPDGSVYFLNGVFWAKDVIPMAAMRYVAGAWQPAGFPANVFVTTIQGSWAEGWIQGETPWHSVILHQQGDTWVTWPEAA